MSDVAVEVHPLPCDFSAPRRARVLVDDRLATEFGGRTGAVELRDDAAIVVTELVTNAVEAGATALRMVLRFESDGMKIVIRDDADGVPRVGEPAALAVRGRGLPIVQTLATAWGFRQHGSRGKSVWATVGLHPDVEPADVQAGTPSEEESVAGVPPGSDVHV